MPYVVTTIIVWEFTGRSSLYSRHLWAGSGNEFINEQPDGQTYIRAHRWSHSLPQPPLADVIENHKPGHEAITRSYGCSAGTCLRGPSQIHDDLTRGKNQTTNTMETIKPILTYLGARVVREEWCVDDNERRTLCHTLIPVRYAWGEAWSIENDQGWLLYYGFAMYEFMATVVQDSFLSSYITPRVSLLSLSLSILVVLEDTPNLARVGHFLQTLLQLFKSEVSWGTCHVPQNSSHVPLGECVPQVQNHWSRQ